MKRKRDAEERYRKNDTKPVSIETADGEIIYSNPEEYMQDIRAGENVSINVVGNSKVINADVGVKSVKVFGQEEITGDVILKAGSNINLSQNTESKEITISASGLGGGGGGGIAKLPIPFASSEFSDSFRVGYAFDNDLSTFWSATGAIGQFIGINFRTDVLVSKISIVDTRVRLKDFVFEGSMDSVNYDELLSATHPQVATKVEYDIPTAVGYIYFRVRCTSALYTGSNMTIDELEMEYQVL